MILARIIHIFALTLKEGRKDKAYKVQCCGRSKTTTLKIKNEKVRNLGSKCAQPLPVEIKSNYKVSSWVN